MIHITDKTMCCGCTACSNVCPQNCITMKPDCEGFLYPVVDESKCINCGLCEKTCPVINIAKEEHPVNTYVLRTKDSDILAASTSGGFITPLAKWIEGQGGAICGAVYDKDFNVVHQILSGGVFLASRIKICSE